MASILRTATFGIRLAPSVIRAQTWKVRQHGFGVSGVNGRNLLALGLPLLNSQISHRFLSSGGQVVDIPLPPLAESIDHGVLASWEKKVGDFCKEDETIAVVDTDKVSVDVKAPVKGELVEVLAGVGDEIKVGQIVARIQPKEMNQTPATSSQKEQPKPEKQAPPSKEVKPPPKPEPTKVETKAAAAEKPVTKQTPNTPQQKATPTPAIAESVGGDRTERHVKMTPMRKTIATRLKEAQNTAASLTTFNEIDMSKLMEMRNKHKDEFLEKHGVKLGFMSAFVVAATKALQELPAVNASIQEDKIVYHDYVDISIAVSSPRGLVVPVLRNCEKMNFADIERNIAELGKKAKDNTLTLEEMAGGTFTITNGGVFGSMMSTPMINLPQSAILGMHNIVERPIAVKGAVVIRPVMYVALTYDHRLIDGRESVTFLKSIKQKIEDPEKLLLGL